MNFSAEGGGEGKHPDRRGACKPAPSAPLETPDPGKPPCTPRCHASGQPRGQVTDLAGRELVTMSQAVGPLQCGGCCVAAPVVYLRLVAPRCRHHTPGVAAHGGARMATLCSATPRWGVLTARRRNRGPLAQVSHRLWGCGTRGHTPGSPLFPTVPGYYQTGRSTIKTRKRQRGISPVGGPQGLTRAPPTHPRGGGGTARPLCGARGVGWPSNSQAGKSG